MSYHNRYGIPYLSSYELNEKIPDYFRGIPEYSRTSYIPRYYENNPIVMLTTPYSRGEYFQLISPDVRYIPINAKMQLSDFNTNSMHYKLSRKNGVMKYEPSLKQNLSHVWKLRR